nr:MAG TPA: hypothetical protein [Caudoviricetes sp.]
MSKLNIKLNIKACTVWDMVRTIKNFSGKINLITKNNKKIKRKE